MTQYVSKLLILAAVALIVAAFDVFQLPGTELKVFAWVVIAVLCAWLWRVLSRRGANADRLNQQLQSGLPRIIAIATIVFGVLLIAASISFLWSAAR